MLTDICNLLGVCPNCSKMLAGNWKPDTETAEVAFDDCEVTFQMAEMSLVQRIIFLDLQINVTQTEQCRYVRDVESCVEVREKRKRGLLSISLPFHPFMHLAHRLTGNCLQVTFS